MGPYCQFCNQRCFVHITFEWPGYITKAYTGYQIAATCTDGKAFEKQKLGYSYDDVKAYWKGQVPA